MKRIYILILAVMVAMSAGFAQDKARKEREEIRKMAEKELNSRVDKTVAKEAKKLEKDGWKVRPGALPLEKQLEKSYMMQYEYDEDLYPKYIMGEATSVGENYDAAKMQAMELAKMNLAGQIQTEVTALVENSIVVPFGYIFSLWTQMAEFLSFLRPP